MADWRARFISPAGELDGAPLLRTEFDLDAGHGDVASATLRYSALGVVEATLNDRPVDDSLLTPGWSSYEWRVRFAQSDVTELLAARNVLGLALGNGWYRGRLTWTGARALYGDRLAGLAELRIRFADGHEQFVGTDASWTCGPSATTADDLYDGQSIDARRRDDSWRHPGFASAAWTGVDELDDDLSRLEPYLGPPVRIVDELAPREVKMTPTGRLVVDFGQNVVGWARVRVTGPAGEVITLRFTETLEHGEPAFAPLRSARATDRFTLSGGDDLFEPTFTFHGFRYADVEGWPGGIEALRDEGGLTAVVVSSDLRRTGRFECSDPLVSRLHENAVWGMRGNFLDVPTDCPQRDERLGWTGDLAAFAPSAVFLFDTEDFLRDWLRDLALEAGHAAGVVPLVVPDALKYIEMGHGEPDATALWGDAAVWVPWAVYTAYGHAEVLADQFESMVGHGRRVRALLSPAGLWQGGFQYGDWLDPDAPADDPAAAKADPDVVATLCAYRTAKLIAASARVLGRDETAVEFDDLATSIRIGFSTHYLADGVIASDCATVYALAIVFGILSDDDLRRGGDRLAELVAAAGHTISTGFAGTPFVTDALTMTGHLEHAYRLLQQTRCPSWLYPLTMGATTIWERWDSMRPDGSVNPDGMTSFNHYALGAVVDWLHRTVGGIAPLEPGYRRVLIAPRPGGDLTWAATELETAHGRIGVRWDREGDRLRVQATVPDGCDAVVRLPDRADEVLGAGRHERVVVLQPRGRG
ncbi:MAG: family 78 glycoside hydrolase catalytic domain [Protaetiibacter sp.]